jgi:hypothetical protein
VLRGAFGLSTNARDDVAISCVREALQYLTDEAGKKTAVVLPISDYEKLLEDLHDLSAIAERRQDAVIPHDQFKIELKQRLV